MSAADIRMFHPYDDFLIAELLQVRLIHTPDDTSLTVKVAGFGFSLTRWAA